MSESVIGRGVIELSADSSGLNAAIDKARKSIAGLGDEGRKSSAASSKGIDSTIKKLSQQRDQLGMTTREIAIYNLAARGASNEQLNLAKSILASTDSYKQSMAARANLRSGFIAAGAAAVVAGVAFVGAMKGAIDFADELGDLSKKTGVTVQDLSGLALAAKQSGTDLNGVADSINKLSQNIGKDGDKFRALGITATEPLEAFKQLADIFVSIEDPQQRAALGAAALGKSWQSAAPLLAEGGANIGKMVEKGKELSGITKELTEDADKFNDELEVLKVRAGGAANMIAGPLLKSLNSLIAEMAEGTKIAGGFGNALMTFGFSSPLGSAADQVKKYGAELRGLEDSLARYRKAGSDTRAIDEAMIKTKQQLQFAQARANREAMDAGYRGKGFDDPRILKAPVDPAVAQKVANFIKTPKEAKAGKSSAGTVDQEAKAQLAADLDQIRKATAAELNIYANAEKIMEARRAANLIEDREYYAEKLAFIQLNSQAAEAESIKEIERLQREKAAGKDKLDNDRKILDAQAKLAKIRADAAANVTVLGVQEKAAADKIVKAYTDARKAAQEYLDTVKNQNAREIEGIGRGAKFRDEQAGRNQIEDKFTGERQKLERDQRNKQISDNEFATYLGIARETYAEEVRLYEQRTAAMNAAQGDWTNGAREALQNYADEAKDIAKQTEGAFRSAFDGLEDALVQFTQTGKLDFKSLISSINADIARMSIRESITGPLAGWLKGQIGSAKPASGIASLASDGKSAALPAETDQASAIGTLSAAIGSQTTALQASTTATDDGAASVRDMTERQREQSTALAEGKVSFDQGRFALDEHRIAVESATKSVNDFATAMASAKPGQSSSSSGGGSSGSGLDKLFGGGGSGGGESGGLGSLGGGGSSLPDVPIDISAGNGPTLFSGGTTVVREGETAPSTKAASISAASKVPVAATAATIAATSATQKATTATTAATKATQANTKGLTESEKKSNELTGWMVGLMTTGGLLYSDTESKSPFGAYSSDMLSMGSSAIQQFTSGGGEPSGNNPYQGVIAAFDGTLPDGSVNYGIAAQSAIGQAKMAVDYGGIAALSKTSTIGGQLGGLFGDKSGSMGGSILSSVGGLIGGATGLPMGAMLGAALGKKLASIKIDTKPLTDSVEAQTNQGFTELGTEASASKMGIGGFFDSMGQSLSNGFGDLSSAFNSIGASGDGGGGLLGGISGLFGGGSGSGAATSFSGMAAGKSVDAETLANLMEYGLAEGGLVKGPGTGTSDSIPVALSNGEFVMPAKQTAELLPLLERMRSGESSASELDGLLGRLGVGEIAAAALHANGARELGGPVSAGQLYRVNEKRPELLNVAGKQYLMMGAQGGIVDANAKMGGGSVTNLHVNVTPPAGSNAATAAQWGATAGRQIQRATARNN